MDLIELAKEIGMLPIRIAQTNGGEFVCSCPKCGDGGKGNNSDRFHIWPNEKAKNCDGRYWCRQCEINGDAIQFCRDFLGLTYSESCSRLNVHVKSLQKHFVVDLTKSPEKFSDASTPNSIWQIRASAFVMWSHNTLWNHPQAIESLKSRGFKEESIILWKLGYCPQTFCRERALWGLPNKQNTDGYLAKLWLPKGVVIPSFSEGNIIKIKIRRSEETQNSIQHKFSKYMVVSGSSDSPVIYGTSCKKILIVESEFDAMLLQDILGDTCCVIALGGAQKRPDSKMHQLLTQAFRILLSLDYDQGGIQANYYWKSLYPQVRVWPVPKGKSPGDALKLGIDLRRWVEEGFK